MTSSITAPIFSNPAYTTNSANTSTASTTSATSSSSASSSSGALGENDFLTLLIAQMKNQDPLNPQDDSSFVAELATFSSVQQETQMNQTIQQSTASGLIGQNVKDSSGDSGVVANAGVNSSGVYVTLNIATTNSDGTASTTQKQVPYASITEIDGFASSGSTGTSTAGTSGTGTGS